MLASVKNLRDRSKMVSDPLSEIVTMTRARCDISSKLVAGAPWALHHPPPRQIKFMAVVAGACWLISDQNETPLRVREGDVLMLSGRPYTLASDPGIAPRDALEVFTDLNVKVVTVGDGADFVAIGGHVTLDPERGWMLADVLPGLVHIDSGSSEASVMRYFLGQLVAEAASDRLGAALMSEQLAQLLFVQTLRSHLSIDGLFTQGWIRVLADERIAPALRLIHREPGRVWRLEDLAKSVAMSRTNFAVRFKAAYLESLKHYDATVNRKRREAFFSAPTAALGIRALFKAVLDCLDDPHTPSPVCLMAGALTSEVLAEPDLRKYVEEQVSTLAEVMIERMVSDKKAGHLSEEFEPQIVVPVIVTYLQGIWRMALVTYNRKKYEKQIDLFLVGLGL